MCECYSESFDDIRYCPLHKAAPELLAACKRALLEIQSGDYGVGTSLACDEEMQSAVAKATGEHRLMES